MTNCELCGVPSPHRLCDECLTAIDGHSQPTVFTWADVDRLRGLAGAFEPDDRVHTWLPGLADRIAALLPPR